MSDFLARMTFGLNQDCRRLALGMFFWEFGYGLYMYLLTIYMQALGATPFQIGTLLWMQGLLRIAVSLPSGLLADRFSRRKVIVLSSAITVPAIASYGLATEWWHLMPGMLLIIAGNLASPSFSSYITDAADPERKAQTFSLIYTVGPSIALIFAPLIGGRSADAVGSRYIFFGAAVFFAAATAAWMTLSERPLTVVGTTQPASYRAALNTPVIRTIACLQFAVVGALAIGTTFLPNYLREVHGFSLTAVGFFGSIGAVGGIMMSVLFARSHRITATRMIGFATLGVGFVCLAVLLTGDQKLLTVAFLGRGGFMVAWSLFAAVLSEVSPPELLNRAFALTELLGSIGFGMAPFIAGALYGWRLGAPLMLTVVLAPILAAGAMLIERQIVTPLLASRRANPFNNQGEPTSPEASMLTP